MIETCQKAKYAKYHQGVLQPLPVPEFPTSPQGHDMIWIVVHEFSKQVHFIPCKKTLKVTKAATLFNMDIFPHHGIPKSIVSNCDNKFIIKFWKVVFDNLGWNSPLFYHPETDGHSEAANKVLLELLRKSIYLW